MEILERLRLSNSKRYILWGHDFEKREELLFLSTAVGGEAGELLNFIKKHARGDKVEMKDIADEIADVIIYLDLLAASLGINLSGAITSKFNEVSNKRGFPIFL